MATYHNGGDLARLVKEKMKAERVWQRDIAEALGVTQPMISKALNGESPGFLERIAEHVLGCRIESVYIIHEEENNGTT